MSEKPVAEQTVNEHRDDDHLKDVPDGAGCTEIWEHLSDDRDEENDELEE
ncbi:hypothetical protein [Haladaptatus sp. W1]|nr:hypothetical protein [Haladaptatus sp. W1]